jgi:hypothetical protein
MRSFVCPLGIPWYRNGTNGKVPTSLHFCGQGKTADFLLGTDVSCRGNRSTSWPRPCARYWCHCAVRFVCSSPAREYRDGTALYSADIVRIKKIGDNRNCSLQRRPERPAPDSHQEMRIYRRISVTPPLLQSGARTEQDFTICKNGNQNHELERNGSAWRNVHIVLYR